MNLSTLLTRSISPGTTFLTALAAVSLLMTPGASAQDPTNLNLPSSFNAIQVENSFSDAAAPSFLNVTFTGIGPGNDLTNGTYLGWCGDIYTTFVDSNPITTLYSSADPNLPANIQTAAWKKVNYILNNKQGDWRDIQRAIWIVLRGVANPAFPATAASNAMITAANSAGANFVPGPGQKVAVILHQGGFNGQDEFDVQDTFIELSLGGGAVFSLGNRVWRDNGNGIQDAGEPGINGVTVKLYNGASQLVGTTTTAAVNGVDGIYGFSGLAAGAYTVDVDGLSPALVNLTPTSVAVGNDRAADSNSIPTTTTLSANNPNDLTLDFGYVAPCQASLGNFVWLDTNANGIQEAGELGLRGVTVQLLNGLGALITSATTDNGGGYLFAGLCGGSYQVKVLSSTLPAGVISATATQAGGNTALDSNPNPSLATLGSSTTDLTHDFGFKGGNACNGTQGYWKNHATGKKAAWPVTGVNLGTQYYTMSQMLSLWNMSVTGNATINLAHQLMAAKLNLYNGGRLGTMTPAVAGGSPTILSWVDEADRLIGSTRVPFNVDSATGARMLEVKDQLDRYNNGQLTGTCHRD